MRRFWRKKQLSPREKWVAALRSGDYEQGRGSLHTTRVDGTNEFCCLGVACDLYQQEVGDLLVTESSPPGTVWYGSTDGFLPIKVQEWLGLTTRKGSFGSRLHPDGAWPDALSCRNDSGESFEQIADLIETEPEGLFL